MNKTLISALLLIIALLIVFTFSLCKKDDGIFTVEAKIYDSGSVALDGCDWFVRVDTTKEYHATNLSNEFKENGVKVIIRYRLLDTKFICGWGKGLPEIKLIDIKRKDTQLVKKDATIVDIGPVTSDGCGWMVKIDTTYYHPTNLPDTYKKADLKVKVSYNLLDSKYQCGIAANLKYNQIFIKTIESR
ncbi:hypothetical protein [Mucilaginibacter sp. UYCu711]|uniref:hypothetical protein n=1 Tax=Mucilaginibacter sp. UYCu711 TaxID=3156339 RepID=UPI003D231A8A